LFRAMLKVSGRARAKSQVSPLGLTLKEQNQATASE
jgi:hypothetical protein